MYTKNQSFEMSYEYSFSFQRDTTTDIQSLNGVEPEGAWDMDVLSHFSVTRSPDLSLTTKLSRGETQVSQASSSLLLSSRLYIDYYDRVAAR
jgi:hypothetical protein